MESVTVAGDGSGSLTVLFKTGNKIPTQIAGKTLIITPTLTPVTRSVTWAVNPSGTIDPKYAPKM